MQVWKNFHAQQQMLTLLLEESAIHLSHVEFMIDRPADQISKKERLVLDYLVFLVEQSNHPRVQQAFLTLVHYDNVRRKSNGRCSRTAAAYAARHVRFFSDRLRLVTEPYLETLDKKPAKPPMLSITYGGPREEEFNVIRTHLAKHATPEGFEAYLATQNIEPDADRCHAQWSDQKESLYPHYSILALGKSGKHPPYYQREQDISIKQAADLVRSNRTIFDFLAEQTQFVHAFEPHARRTALAQ